MTDPILFLVAMVILLWVYCVALDVRVTRLEHEKDRLRTNCVPGEPCGVCGNVHDWPMP